MPAVAPDAVKAIELDQRSRLLRKKVVDVLVEAGGGHFGPTVSILEILRVLYDDVMSFDSKRPDWSDRDRFILSKGHGCLALYVLLADKGFFPESELFKFCKDGALLGGHPVVGIPGVEATTGSLGHGLSIGVGMAIALRHDRKDQRVFVVVGDGECNEGSIWEAALTAGKHKLDNLIVLIDRNGMQNCGDSNEILDMEPFADKLTAFGFAVTSVNGHDLEQLRTTLGSVPLTAGKPTAVICHTLKGKGIKATEEDSAMRHYLTKPEHLEKLILGLEELR